jgi:hypothetical protein
VNRYQKIALGLVAANLLLVLLFPPFDQHSIAGSQAPAFIGFHFVLTPLPYSEVNSAVLLLVIFVILANAGIALLLMRESPSPAGKVGGRYQNAVLVLVGVNLVLVLLFPPFESVFALTNAALPTFEGFYFIFHQQPNHTIVITLLYLEVLFILANGALLWLVFRRRQSASLSPEQAVALAAQLRRKG